MVFLTNINLNQNELQNAIIQPLAVAPANPKLGQIYCDSVSSKIKWYDGTAWKTIGVVVEESATNGNIIVDGVEMTVYELPAASTTTLGGVKVGAGLSVDANGVLSATGGGTADAVEWENVLNKPDTYPSAEHTHDGRYYTESESDELLLGKVDKVDGKDLSTNDYTTAEKNKLAGIAQGAEVNVNADWNATAGDAQVLNKPTALSDFTNDGGFITAADNVATATKLATARTIALSGDASGSASFDGSANVSIVVVVADDSHNHIIENVDGLQAELNGKAPLASPALTGTPTTPTAAAGTKTTQIASTAFVKNEIDAVVQALEAHVNAGTVNGTGVIMSVNDNVITQPVVVGTTNLGGLTDYSAGWEFRVTTAGTISGIGVVQPGDWVVCVSDYSSAYSASDWTVIQTNIDITTTITNDDTKVPTAGAVFDYAQPIDADLSAIAALTGTGILRKTGTNTWSIGTTIATGEIAANAVTNAKMATMPASTFKGNIAGNAAVPSDLTVAQMQAAIGITGAVLASTSSIAVGSTSATITKSGIITNVLLYDAAGEQIIADVTISNAGKTATISLAAAYTSTITVVCSYVGI